ncbi:MAG: carboxypeptidase-like regulatory domain-containing protein, partial [Bacteroidales bacterium]|nr:carboxypeptidase-like regulatory domain-containing protein [Bacteroidales bacterium]
MKKRLFTIFLLFFTLNIWAQNRYTLSGYIREKGSRELLPGVNIYLPQQKTGTITNNYGFYSITLPQGHYEIQYSYV